VSTQQPHGRGDHSGLLALCMLARLSGCPADLATLKHRYQGRHETPQLLLRAAATLGLDGAKRHSDHLETCTTPCLLQRKDRSWVVLAKVASGRALVQSADHHSPILLPIETLHTEFSGWVLNFRRYDEVSRQLPFGLRWFLEAARPYRHLFAEVLVASAVVQLLALLLPLFFQVVVDKVLVHRVESTLQVLVVGLLLVSVFEVVLSGLRSGLLNHTTSRMDVVLGARLYHHLLSLPLAFFESRRVGDVVARVRELDSLRQFVTGTALVLVIDLVFSLLVFAVMMAYSSQLTAVVALSLPLYLAVSLLSGPVLRSQIAERFRRGAENQSFLVESVSGIDTLKSMALEPSMQRRWEDQTAGYVRASFRQSLTATLATQSAQMISRFTTAAILWFGATAVIRNELSVGELIAFNLFAGRISAPVLRLFQVWQDFQQARVSLSRLGDILNAPAETDGSRISPQRVAGRITFEQVSFRYQPDRPRALDEVSLTIAPGEVVGIVGPSGSGKSTLARLLQRLSAPENGRILVDGVDIHLLPTSVLRSRIGVVPQSTFLFNASVRDNIALGDPAMPMHRIVRAAEIASAHAFICELPNGYDTILGEHAHMLSGGQKQRLAIARALIRDPAILIFDEATSALDYESEHAVQRNLAAICQGRTVLIIAHRLSSLSLAERILVFDRGRLTEHGSAPVLQRSGGFFSRLYQAQTGNRSVA